MQAKVKEFFNHLVKEEDKENEQEMDEQNSSHSPRRLGGVRAINIAKIPNLTNLEHFIECEISPDVCPMLWEELDVDFEDASKRYCKHCDSYVYKADNEYMIEKLQNENKCMAIPERLAPNPFKERLKLSKLFLLYKPYLDENMTYIEQLKFILLELLDVKSENRKKRLYAQEKLRWLRENGVDMKFIFQEIVFEIDDKDFIDTINKKFEQL